MKAVTVLWVLLLQGLHSRAKPIECATCLARGLELWVEGQIGELLLEGHSIQQHLYSQSLKPRAESKLAHSFANLMFQGNTKAAICLLTENGRGEVLRLDELTSDGKTVLEVLKSKHPPPQLCSASTLLHPDLGPLVIHPVAYRAIDAHSTRTVAPHTFGAGGSPSGTDATCWRRLCTSFEKPTDDLCHAIALVTKICSSLLILRACLHYLLVA